METVRAWRTFEDLNNKRYGRGVVRLEVGEGSEVRPHQSVASVVVGNDESGVDMSVGVEHFGRITKLLVKSGAEVTPGQPLLEYEPRPPTTDEYWAEWERGYEPRRGSASSRGCSTTPSARFGPRSGAIGTRPPARPLFYARIVT